MRPPDELPGTSKALWLPVICRRCGVPKRDDLGRMLYHDLLAEPGWVRRRDGTPVRLRVPRKWECDECIETIAALWAIDGRRRPVDPKY